MPVASVLSVLIHTLIQLGVLIVIAAVYHKFPNVNWLFIPFVFLCLSIFACGMSLLFSGINVYIRDTRYVVESGNTILFWLVPIVYPLTVVPPRFRNIYLWNPLVPMIEALRAVILTASAPSMGLIVRMVSTSVVTLIIGWLVFRALKPRFYNYL